MPKYEVDVKRTEYGYVIIHAKNKREAIEKIKRFQIQPKVKFTGSDITPVGVNEAP